MDRRTVVLELIPESRPSLSADRRDRLDAVRRSTASVKERVVRKLESLRRIDPTLTVESKETIFPVLIVTATNEVLEKISKDPDVKGVAPATEFRALDEGS